MSSEQDDVRNEPGKKHCPVCKKPLTVRKTRKRRVVTSHGELKFTEVERHCNIHTNQIFRSETRLAPHKSRYGYDLIGETGRLRYLEHKQISEISEKFKERGISVPARTVHRLSERFLQYVYAAHLDSLPELSKSLKRRGGYVMHVDGTGNKGSMVLLVRDGWSGTRLFAASIPSESEESVRPLLKNAKKYFGVPVAAVRDMGKGIERAIKTVFPNTYTITCHYHFLRDIGHTLFDTIYPRFRNMVDKRGVKKRIRNLARILKSVKKRRALDEDEVKTHEMVERILAFPKDGGGLAYPFSLPAADYYRRCDDARCEARLAIVERGLKGKHSPFLSTLEDALGLLRPPPAVLGRIESDFKDLEERRSWFQRVRAALMYRNGPIPLSTDIRFSDRHLEKGRKKVDALLEKIAEFERDGGTNRRACQLRKSLRKVTRLLCDRRDELFAPNVCVISNGRKVTRKLPRTNAPNETDFRRIRRHGRRIRGNNDVERQVQREGSGMLIALNLMDPRYVKTVYGSLAKLPARFAKLSSTALSRAKSFMTISSQPA